MIGLQLKFLLGNLILEHCWPSPFDDLVGELDRQVLHQHCELFLKCGVEGIGGVVRGVTVRVLEALAEVAVVRLESIDVLGEFGLGDASGFHGLGPVCSRVLLADQMLQFLPELGATHVHRDEDLHRL